MDNNEYGFKKDTLFLVTGGAGFIGSNICERLIEMGYRVRCLDNFSTGSTKNIESLLKTKTFELIKGDINDINVCVNACEGVDYVLHQAAFGSVPRSIESPVLFCKNNISGSVNMLEAARQSKVKKFVYASSSSVYGDSALLPQKEGQEGRVLSPYALTKRCVEEWAQQYYYHYGVPTIGLRYFNVFGRKQNPNGAYAAVIPRFITCLLKGERPTIYGDGKQSRDFTCVENVIQANLKACLTDDRANGQVFNISNGEEVPLFEVYQKIATILNTDLIPEYCSARKGDIRHSCADIEKAKTLLSYEPKTTFDQGIKAAIDWYRRVLQGVI